MTDPEALLHGDPDLPTLLQRLMERNRYDQMGLARELGVNQGALSRWLSRTRDPVRDSQAAIARVAGISVADVGAVIARTEKIREKPKREIERDLEEMRARLEAAEAQIAELRAASDKGRP